MHRVFNCGIGMVVVVAREDVQQAVQILRDAGEPAVVIGSIKPRASGRLWPPTADQQEGVDPTDLKSLVDYFHGALVKELKPQMQIVNEPGPGVIVLRIALTDLVPTQVSRSLAGTAIPYGFVAEAGSGVATGRPAGSTPYLGETGIEMQFLDGASGVVLAECADTQIGRKYAADVDAGAAGATNTWVKGYMSSFQSWSYARDAFDKWARQIATRFAVLRGVEPPK
jgi:hypothetical protein